MANAFFSVFSFLFFNFSSVVLFCYCMRVTDAVCDEFWVERKARIFTICSTPVLKRNHYFVFCFVFLSLDVRSFVRSSLVLCACVTWMKIYARHWNKQCFVVCHGLLRYCVIRLLQFFAPSNQFTILPFCWNSPFSFCHLKIAAMCDTQNALVFFATMTTTTTTKTLNFSNLSVLLVFDGTRKPICRYEINKWIDANTCTIDTSESTNKPNEEKNEKRLDWNKNGSTFVDANLKAVRVCVWFKAPHPENKRHNRRITKWQTMACFACFKSNHNFLFKENKKRRKKKKSKTKNKRA